MGVGKYPSKFDTARSCREIGATYLGGDMLYGLLCTGYILLLQRVIFTHKIMTWQNICEIMLKDCNMRNIKY